ncbi:DUF3592 domain-containing protein [Marilutibacter chinensis]|uniref:DUF3592 domain-containing protein n=1 Tax=Marilutibacter chinensis TaxID=2912247 RepID=A0ABS9HME1_9GAMM|nr:DUF3592 domain-containing protein [Lysobacter chinensis]MCF7220201.1 DUF3592 domain-containing protein [Lysobacter chinensis]
MAGLILGIAIPVGLALAMVAIVAWRAVQMRRLVEDGVEAEGRVIERISHATSARQSQKRLRYEYRDHDGQRHEHLSLVPDAFWNSHPVGARIAVAYVRSRPGTSAPLELVRQARQAVERS